MILKQIDIYKTGTTVKSFIKNHNDSGRFIQNENDSILYLVKKTTMLWTTMK